MNLRLFLLILSAIISMSTSTGLNAQSCDDCELTGVFEEGPGPFCICDSDCFTLSVNIPDTSDCECEKDDWAIQVPEGWDYQISNCSVELCPKNGASGSPGLANISLKIG